MLKINGAVFLVILTAIMFIAASAYSLDLNEKWLPEKPEWFPELSAKTAFLTKYIWRGQTLVDDPVIQPDASVSKWGFTFNIWMNYDTGETEKITELDYTFTYEFNFGEMAEKMNVSSPDLLAPLSINGGYIYYTFPIMDWSSKEFDTHEFFLGCSYDVLLQPHFKWYQDVDTGRGAYFELGAGHAFVLGGGISAGLSATADYNAGQWGYKDSWSNLLFTGDMSVPVLGYFIITPTVSYSLRLDNQYKNEFYGGASVSVEY